MQEKSGFIPNVFLVLARRPDEFRAFFAYHDALMDKPGNLSKAEREMIVVATSAANQCQYCVVAHGAILRIRAKNPLLADQVAVNYRKADITPRQKAMIDFAMKVAFEAYAVGDEAVALHVRGALLRATGAEPEALDQHLRPIPGLAAVEHLFAEERPHVLTRTVQEVLTDLVADDVRAVAEHRHAECT